MDDLLNLVTERIGLSEKAATALIDEYGELAAKTTKTNSRILMGSA